MSYANSENHKRNVRVLAEGAQGKKMTRKVDITEYESMATCIKTDQVPPSEIAEIFTDKKFYKYYKNNWL